MISALMVCVLHLIRCHIRKWLVLKVNTTSMSVDLYLFLLDNIKFREQNKKQVYIRRNISINIRKSGYFFA